MLGGNFLLRFLLRAFQRLRRSPANQPESPPGQAQLDDCEHYGKGMKPLAVQFQAQPNSLNK